MLPFHLLEQQRYPGPWHHHTKQEKLCTKTRDVGLTSSSTTTTMSSSPMYLHSAFMEQKKKRNKKTGPCPEDLTVYKGSQASIRNVVLVVLICKLWPEAKASGCSQCISKSVYLKATAAATPLSVHLLPPKSTNLAQGHIGA